MSRHRKGKYIPLKTFKHENLSFTINSENYLHTLKVYFYDQSLSIFIVEEKIYILLKKFEA